MSIATLLSFYSLHIDFGYAAKEANMTEQGLNDTTGVVHVQDNPKLRFMSLRDSKTCLWSLTLKIAFNRLFKKEI